MTKKQDEQFFEDIVVPINEDWKENGLQKVNPVHVADMFAEATGTVARLAQMIEESQDSVRDLEDEQVQTKRALLKIRRSIIAENLDELKASWSAEVVDAFIWAMATTLQRGNMERLEEELDNITDALATELPLLEKYRARMKILERNMEYAGEYLNYEKLQDRIQHNLK